MGRSDVEAGEKRWLKAFNGGDASGVAACYAQDARLMAPNADIVEGRPAIEGFVKEFLAARATLAFELVDVYDQGDLCVAIGTYNMDLRPEGAPPQQDRGKYMEVWQRRDEGWVITDDIFNSSLPAPTP